MRKKWLVWILCSLIFTFGVNEITIAQFSGSGAFGAVAGYLRRVGTDILPSIDNTYDLGSVASSWNDAHFEGTATIGTLAVGATTMDGDLTFSNANPNIIGGDDDGAMTFTADTAINQGGSIRLYGNNHASQAQDLEFYADATVVLTWDESGGHWDFNDEDVVSMGDLGVNAITTADDFTFSTSDPVIFGGDTDGVMSITPDTSVAQGGNIKLYGNTHTSLAGDVEIYTDATMILSYDLTETNWDFDGENVVGMGVLTLPSAGLHLLDTGADHDLIVTYNENAGQDNTLNIILGDASRTITLSGNPTMGDWFDQAVKAASNVAFGTVGCGVITQSGTTLALTYAPISHTMASHSNEDTYNISTSGTAGMGSTGCGRAAVPEIGVSASAPTTMPAATTAARHAYFAGNITELAGATISDIVGCYVNSFTVTDGGAGETVGILASLYVPDAPTAGTTPTTGPYAVYVAAGSTVLDDLTVNDTLGVTNATTLSGAFMHGTEAVTPTDAGIAASLVKTVTIMTSESDEVDADAISLAAGTIGQIKIFIFKVETDAGDTIVLTPASPIGFATITFDAIGDSATLISDGTNWHLLNHNNATIG